MVYIFVEGAPRQEFPKVVVPVIVRTGIVDCGTSSPVALRIIGVPGKPVKLITASWAAVKVPVEVPTNILPPVPDVPAVPVHQLTVSAVPVHVIQLLGATASE